jgi:uroporphyrinogen-III synthase
MSLDGLRVVSFESRRAAEMAKLIENQGGLAFVAPSVRERAVEDNAGALQFLEQLESGAFDMVICMTGVGLKFLRDAVASQIPEERLAAALRRATVVARGPKPVAVLRQLNVPIEISIPEPNTDREILHAVGLRQERRVALLEYGRPNEALIAGLEKQGKQVVSVALYRWEMPEDLTPLREAARRIARGECDVALFTSSIQLEHLLDVAGDLGLTDEVRDGLAKNAAIVSIGPVMSATLEEAGLKPDIQPEHPRMGTMMHAAAELAPAIVQAKRTLRP